MTPDRFWPANLSSDEVAVIFEGEQKRQDRLYELAIVTAWHVAAFTNAKKLPSLEKILERMRVKSDKPAEKQDFRVMQAAMSFIGTPDAKPKRKVRRGEPIDG